MESIDYIGRLALTAYYFEVSYSEPSTVGKLPSDPCASARGPEHPEKADRRNQCRAEVTSSSVGVVMTMAL